MQDKALKFSKVIYEWLSQFATTYRGVLPAGVEPDNIYLQFSGEFDNIADHFILGVNIYALNTASYLTVLQLSDKIGTAIGDGGIEIGDKHFRVVINKGSPFYQDKADEDKTVRAGYINLDISIFVADRKAKYKITFTDDVMHSNRSAWYFAGETITLPSDIPYDYLEPYFAGWSDGINIYAKGSVFTIPEHDVVFSAVWQDLEEWTITFIANNEIVDTRTYDYLHRTIITPPVPEVYGYTGKWEAFDIFSMSGDFTVEAQYTPRPELLLSGVFTAENRVQTLRRSDKK